MNTPAAQAIDLQALQEALAQLHDISQPAEPSWWPLAPGWWGLIALAVAVLLGCFLFRLWWRKTALKRAAAKHMHAVTEASQELDDHRFLQALAETLRRAAKQRYPETVGLADSAWAEHLNHTGKTNYFTTNAGAQLLQARFAKVVAVDREQQLAAVQAWLKVAL